MKKKNIILLGVGLISSILVLMLICIYFLKGRDVYELNLPEYEEVEKIVFEKNGEIDTLNSNNYIEVVMNILDNMKKTTYKESVQDYPVNIDNLIKIDIYLKNDSISTIFMYEENNKYYIEQPYNGIYKLKKDEFENINYFIFQEKLNEDLINRLKETKTIVVNNYSNDKLIKNITNDEKISDLTNILSKATRWNGGYNDIGLEYKLYFLDKDNLYIAEALVLPDFHLLVDEEHYFLIDIDMDLVRKVIEG